MNLVIKNSLKVIGVYVSYLILTIIGFYITGMYVWNQVPTKLVLMRMLIVPVFLTLITVLLIGFFKKKSNVN